MSNPPTLRPSDSPIAPCCLTIAGSDSGGNAGVQADLRAFHGYGLHGCTVFAALTAQNPTAVTAIHPVPADFVAAQLDAVLGVYAIRGLKTGMLADPVAIEVIADRLAAHPEIAKVIDPVMVATSGVRLVPEATTAAINYTQNFMGASDAALGDTRPDNTSAIVALQRASNAPLELVKLNMYESIEDLGRIYLDHMRVYYGTRYVQVKMLTKDQLNAQPLGMTLPEVVEAIKKIVEEKRP